MSDSSLKENKALSTLDILQPQDREWLITMGAQNTLQSGSELIQEGQVSDTLNIILAGTLAASVTTRGKEPLTIFQGETGALVGIDALINAYPSTMRITTLTSARILRIPKQKLLTKLQQDRGFAARFYHTAAIALSNQLRQISAFLVRSQAKPEQPLRKVLFVFAELTDNDVAWMVSTGQSIRTVAGQVLIQEGVPADALYLLLEGSLSVFITATIDGAAVSKEVAKLATGEIVGEMSFIDANPPSATVKAIANSLVLALPRSPLSEKLQQDEKFAARFYRAIAIVLADRLRDRLLHHGYSKLAYNQDQPLDENAEYEDELDVDLLDHVALAGARFDWLLRQVRNAN